MHNITFILQNFISYKMVEIDTDEGRSENM